MWGILRHTNRSILCICHESHVMSYYKCRCWKLSMKGWCLLKNVRFELSFCRFLKYDLTHQLLEFLKILVLMLCIRLLTSDCIFLVFQYVYHCELYHFSYIIAYLSFNIHQLLFPPFSYLLFGLFSTMILSFTLDSDG